MMTDMRTQLISTSGYPVWGGGVLVEHQLIWLLPAVDEVGWKTQNLAPLEPSNEFMRLLPLPLPDNSSFRRVFFTKDMYHTSN